MMKSIVLIYSCSYTSVSKNGLAMRQTFRANSLPDSFEIFSECSRYAYLFIKTRKLTTIFFKLHRHFKSNISYTRSWFGRIGDHSLRSRVRQGDDSNNIYCHIITLNPWQKPTHDKNPADKIPTDKIPDDNIPGDKNPKLRNSDKNPTFLFINILNYQNKLFNTI